MKNSAYEFSTASKEFSELKGKQFRASLVAHMGHLLGTDNSSIALFQKCIENTHLASLIHDDIIDDAEMRRGEKSLHLRVKLNQAILFGDYLLAESMGQLLQKRHYQAASELASSISKLAMGEWRASNWSLDERLSPSNWKSLCENKTTPLIHWALSVCFWERASRDDVVEKKLSQLSHELGELFQMHDDVADLCGDEVKEGKPSGKDWSGRSCNIVFAAFASEDDATREKMRQAWSDESQTSPPPFFEQNKQRLLADFSLQLLERCDRVEVQFESILHHISTQIGDRTKQNEHSQIAKRLENFRSTAWKLRP